MLCPKCGAWMSDDSVFCSKCGESLSGEQRETPPTVELAPIQPEPESTPQPQTATPKMQNYLTQNILLTVFSVICCLMHALPTAVTGLVFSAIAQGDMNRGEIEKAKQDIKIARIFMWISFGLEIAAVVYLIISLIFFSAGIGTLISNIIHNPNFNFQWD
jgi:predicted nucleic acid-binding Zn ribbon protein